MDRDEDTRRQYLDAMGIQIRLAREPRTLPAVAGEDAWQSLLASEPYKIAGLDWVALRAEVAACTRCGLHERRTHAVFGVGNPRAQWMIIGEAPGADEDRQGEHLVARAGNMLNDMLFVVGF